MKKPLNILVLTVCVLLGLDVLVAGVLFIADGAPRLERLVRYFEFGRSVPGKLERWESTPDMRDNLYDFAWRDGAIAVSRRDFAEEPDDMGPVVRSYGMSFVNNIIGAAVEQNPDVVWDRHSGPAAPPNYTYALFQDDRGNRRPGDIVVLGILSSSVPAMAALSSSTWSFEQPAPFTYPIYWPEEETDLIAIAPLVASASQQRALRDNPAAAAAWAEQLAREDLFYGPQTFGMRWLDVSPFARLVRRSLATGHIEQTKVRIISGQAYPYAEVLRRMIAHFVDTAREDGQVPVVLLVQSRDRRDADVLSIAVPVLEEHEILYFATAEHFDPSNLGGFLGDGHYAPEIDAMFGRHFIEIIRPSLTDSRE